MAADPRIDPFIAAKPAFARPILQHLRALVHQECPEAVEDIKWSRVVFLLRGKIAFNMAAFSHHCGFGFWNPEMRKVLARDGIEDSGSSGSLGKLTKLDDLPPRDAMIRYLREARRLAENPPKTAPKKKGPPRAEIALPPEFGAALDKNKVAAEAFRAFSPSHRREYLEWISEAKRPETREKRISTAMQWLAEGKSRNWKYQ